MFVTNLTNGKLGVDGNINLRPLEENRYIDEKNEDLVARVKRLAKAKLVTYTLGEGIEKPLVLEEVKPEVKVETPKAPEAPKAEEAPAELSKEPVADKKTVAAKRGKGKE